MSKKINFGTINTESLEKLSNFHVAIIEIAKLDAKFKTEAKKIQEKINTIIKDRETELENGTMTRDEVITKFSTVNEENELRKLKVQHEKDIEPHKNAKKKALELIPENCYNSYKIAMSKGSATNLSKNIGMFLNEIGIATPENPLQKFTNVMTIWVSGARNTNSKKLLEGEYITSKSSKQFNELFMRAFLQYVITEKGVVTVNDDNTLSMTVYEE